MGAAFQEHKKQIEYVVIAAIIFLIVLHFVMDKHNRHERRAPIAWCFCVVFDVQTHSKCSKSWGADRSWRTSSRTSGRTTDIQVLQVLQVLQAGHQAGQLAVFTEKKVAARGKFEVLWQVLTPSASDQDGKLFFEIY
jgi:hypothetical protein|eukprot:2848970-Prymnesium_polylepis.2